MNIIIYNISTTAGVAMVGAGIGLAYGIGQGLAAAGLLLLALTVYGRKLA